MILRARSIIGCDSKQNIKVLDMALINNPNDCFSRLEALYFVSFIDLLGISHVLLWD